MVVIQIAPKTISLFYNSGNSKAFKILSFIFKLYYVVFGLDFGFCTLKSYKIKLFFNFISFVKSLILCYLCAQNIYVFKNIKVFFYFTIYLFHYLAYVLLLFSKSDTFCDLLKDLEIIDLGVRVNKSSYNLEIKILFAIFTSFLYRATVHITFCIVSGNCSLSFWKIVLLIFLMECASLVHITNTFVFYSVYCRFNTLISILKMPKADITYLKHIYKSLVDVIEKHKSAFDLVLIISLTFFIPETMFTIYFAVSEIMIKRTTAEIYSIDLCMDCATILATSILTLLPALCAGALTSQASKLNLILHDKLLQQQDEDQIREIERFIGYMEARGCQFRVCQVIPLDADLLEMVLSFCVTYLIVIIQFTDFKN